MLPAILALVLQLPAAVGMIPAKLETAAAPSSIPNAIAGTCVLADIAVDRQGRVVEIRILQGLDPFRDSAADAIRQWKFAAAHTGPGGQASASRVGVLTVFRPPAIGSDGVGGPAFGYKEPASPGSTHAPYPRTVKDPGYPPSALGAGATIIELSIDRRGRISNMRTVQDVPALTGVTPDAIQSWEFVPAMESGQPVDGTLVVVMLFPRPVVRSK